MLTANINKYSGNVIDNLTITQGDKGACITYFFCCYNEPESLKADTILRSIVRQSLDSSDLPSEVERTLQRLLKDRLLDISGLKLLLQKRLDVSKPFYMVLDALDECEKSERTVLLTLIRDLVAMPRSPLRVFFAARNSIDTEVEHWLPSVQRIIMECDQHRNDIKIYIECSLKERIANKSLVVESEEIITEIEDALNRGADNM